MKQMLKRALLLSLLLFPFTAYSWGPVGHMLVANIAYQNLKPEVRDKVDQLVSYLHTEYPSMTTFTQTAYWPDTLKFQNIHSYDHWHYINLPLNADGTPMTVKEKDLILDDNAVWVVNKIQDIVKNQKKGNPYERARFLSFLTHVVGDLHQPLHSVTYISAEHPDGDRGGNGYKVKFEGHATQLHHVWDSGVGMFDENLDQQHINTLTNEITARYPEAYFAKETLDDLKPENWAQEGLAKAKTSVYNTPEKQALSTQYIQAGQQTAEQQVALAGYRLARMLNTMLS